MHLELPPWTWTICLDCPVPGNPKIPHRQQKILLEISCVGEAPCFVGTTTWPYPPYYKDTVWLSKNKPSGQKARSVSCILQEISKKKTWFAATLFHSLWEQKSKRNPSTRNAQNIAMLPLCRYSIYNMMQVMTCYDLLSSITKDLQWGKIW